MLSIKGAVTALGIICLLAGPGRAMPAFVLHEPALQVFGEPAGTTCRDPEVPREDEHVVIHLKTGPSFTYDNVIIYYTTDGSEPQGAFGEPAGSTQVLRNTNGGISFLRNEPGQSGNDDWWRATLPIGTRDYETRIRYKVSSFDAGGGGEVFAGSGAAYEYTNKLAWPGAGFGSPSPDAGYPPVHFWKEEGIVGNNYINIMIDQNGSLYDVYYPSVGTLQGMATKNEGYDDGNRDEFPSCLTPERRGQMNVNFGTFGLRLDGVTYWFSNQSGVAYTGIQQQYIPDTNVIITTSRLQQGGQDLRITQHDFSPKGIEFPIDSAGNPNRGLSMKRILIENNTDNTVELNGYYFVDWALNGGDGFDGTFTDPTRGAMIAYDNTLRTVSNSNGCGGEYNPTTFPTYTKDVSVYLAASMKQLASPSASGGAFARDFWSDTSADQGLGWVGTKIILGPRQTREIDIALVGGFDGFASATGTYDAQIDDILNWFNIQSLSSLQLATEQHWRSWLAQGVQFTSPDARYNDNYRRGLLATALHLDGRNGGIIAGMHNGAYPFVWPRDAAWAAITLARTGFITEAKEIFRFLRDIAYRDVDGWGRKGFWKQKYTTDGYTAWGNPQVDETSCYPWGVKYIYDVTGEIPFLQEHYDEVYEAGLASSQDSTFDSRIRYEEGVSLMYSMSIWEDAFDVFVYSNASVIRGLEDAAAIADTLNNTSCPGGPNMCGYHADRDLFTSRASAIRTGVDARLDWNGENTDISQAGIVYPMGIYEPGHPRPELVFDRFNGVAPDRFGNFHPIVNFSGGSIPEWEGLINRYWADSYWNGGPWFLSTLWYGAYYALRQDITPGTADIDNFKYRFDRVLDFRGGLGLGAEQMARNATAVYPGFYLQAAFPNAWESMSFLVDASMLFLDWTPDAEGNILHIRPKLPSSWPSMRYENIRMGPHRIDVLVERTSDGIFHTLTNRTGQALEVDTVLRQASGSPRCAVVRNGQPVAFDANVSLSTVQIATGLETGPGAVTVLAVLSRLPGDVSRNGAVDFADIAEVLSAFGASTGSPFAGADTNGDGLVSFSDVGGILAAFGAACP